MKVLHVIPSLAARTGGPAAAAVQFARVAAENGIESAILATEAAYPAGTRRGDAVADGELVRGADEVFVRLYPLRRPYRLARSPRLRARAAAGGARIRPRAHPLALPRPTASSGEGGETARRPVRRLPARRARPLAAAAGPCPEGRDRAAVAAADVGARGGIAFHDRGGGAAGGGRRASCPEGGRAARDRLAGIPGAARADVVRRRPRGAVARADRGQEGPRSAHPRIRNRVAAVRRHAARDRRARRRRAPAAAGGARAGARESRSGSSSPACCTARTGSRRSRPRTSGRWPRTPRTSASRWWRRSRPASRRSSLRRSTSRARSSAPAPGFVAEPEPEPFARALAYLLEDEKPPPQLLGARP